MYRVVRAVALAGLLMVGQRSVALADEMRVVTTGYISWGAIGDREFAFGGDDFSFEGGLSAGVDPSATHSDKAAGDVFTARNVWSGLDIRSGTGTAAVDGAAISAPFLEGWFELLTGPIVIPTSGAETVTVQAPFSFSEEAFAAGWDSNFQLPESVLLFRFGLLGSGVATTTLRMTPGTNRYDHVSTVWTFSSQPAAVPEPGSMILFGTALAGLVAARRRQKRRIDQ